MPRRCFAFLLFLLLAGCGTLKIDVDYGSTPGISGASSTPTPANVPAVSANNPTGTAMPSATQTSVSSETASTPPVLRATAVASGKAHTCVVTDAGRVKCWGKNEYRQLGNGGMVNSNIPVDVIGLTDVKSVTAGWEHTCALTNAGGVKCWGYNQNGELGNGEMSDRGVPVDVSGLGSGVLAIEAGDDHTCAVTDKGEVKCWGYNRYGQLGDGSTTSRSVPVAVQGLPVRAAAVAAGWGHTCVLTDDKSVKCWGDDEYGQLGYGQTEDYRFSPVDVTGLVRNVVRISADGGQTCVLTIYGGVSCWGNNKYGQLGDGSSEIRNSPMQVAGLTQDVIDIAAGWNHTCSLVSGRGMKCWGWNYFGQLGDGTKASRAEPVLVYGLSERIDAMGVGWAHTCVVTGLGGVKCWGQNESGQLGDGTNLDSQVPLVVVGMAGSPADSATLQPTRTASLPPSATKTPKPTQTRTKTATATPTVTKSPVHSPTIGSTQGFSVSAGQNFTCALRKPKSIYCWGAGEFGQLGNGLKTSSDIPVEVIGVGEEEIRQVAAGNFHACALTVSGKMICWGANGHGQLGDGTTTDSPVAVRAYKVREEVADMALGSDFTCARMSAGPVNCWGGNAYGQLGDGNDWNSSTPVPVQGFESGAVFLTAGYYSACAIHMGNYPGCWGDNQYGQLGDYNTKGKSSMVPLSSLNFYGTAITMGKNHACGLTLQGEVLCWGMNAAGQLGDGTDSDHLMPQNVVDPGSIIAIGTGDEISCVLTDAGEVKCWGQGDSGVLGRPPCVESAGFCSEPVLITGLSGPVAAITVGNHHVCALLKTGGIMCWGSNTNGQLGDGTQENRYSPVNVIGFEGSAGPSPTSRGMTKPTNTHTPKP